MTFEEKRKELIEIDKKIEALMARKLELNPFANLKAMSNKQFGEQWSESYIREKCPNLIKNNGRGHDVITMNGEKWEIKSIRLPCKNTAFNQCHPFDCDKFLFVGYDCETGEVYLYLVPSNEIKENLNYSAQHSYGKEKEEADCIMVPFSQTNQRKLQEKYLISDFSILNNLAGM